MSDPADKSDDLIAELAKLMAVTGGKKGVVAPVQIPGVLATPPRGPAPAAAAPAPQPAAPAPQSAAPAPTPFRIPGMDAPVVPRSVAASPAPAAAPIPQPETRAPVTGAIRIPGMDQPAPVATSAPVGKIDFGKPAPIKQEPLSSLSERLAAFDPKPAAPASRVEPTLAPSPPPVRIPSQLSPVSENKSFAEGPALVVPKPTMAPLPQVSPAAETPQPQQGGGDFHFDFGFGPNTVKGPVQPSSAPANDPIGDLIAAEMAGSAPADIPDAPTLGQASAAEFDASSAPEPRPAAPQPMASKPQMAQLTPAAARPVSNAPIPLKPVSVAPRPADDRFATSPAASINPAAPQPLSPQARAPRPAPPPPSSVDGDPMAEIESLIGEAVRVELAAPGPVRVQAPAPMVAKADLGMDQGVHLDAPVVPPLSGQFAPRRAGLRDEGTASAEDAILAAAAATGTPVGRVDPSTAEERPYRRLKVKPARKQFLSGGMRQYIGMAVAGTLLLAAGLGLYWVFNMGRTPDTGATAPQLTADATPIKVKPEASASAETDAARSPVLEQMAGGASSAPSTEQLVSTDETAGGTVPRDVTAATADTSESGLANRKVRTVTVRPDGTIVSGDDSVAGTAELPVDRPNVPTVPGAETTTAAATPTTSPTDPIASTIAENSASSSVAPLLPADTQTAETQTAEADVQPVMDPTQVAPQPITFPVRSESTRALAFDSTPTTPVNAVITGAQTPNGQIDLLAVNNDTVAATPAAPASAGSAAAYVQIASSLTEAEANGAIKSATAKWGSLFGGNQLIVQKADLGAKGIRYRVRLPAASLADATRICAEIKANGGDCFATNA